MGVLRVGLCPGLTQEMIQLLRSRGIKTVVDLVSADLEEVAQKCGLSYKALVALRRVLLAQFSAFPLNGADLYEELKTSTAILSTGIGSLDKLLDAGLYTGEVTEIVGGPGSGKTQVCLCVAANVAHSLQQNVLYVDSSGGLTASRLLQLLQAKTQDEEEQAEALQRIQVVYAFDIFQMLDVLQELRGTVVQQRLLQLQASCLHTSISIFRAVKDGWFFSIPLPLLSGRKNLSPEPTGRHPSSPYMFGQNGVMCVSWTKAWAHYF
ncbi:DNA repair protein RAD51 homolog 4 isoform X2 [Saimiri boliviensis]|uniref:DNA repair protein RAD51 homolog 4 isoform X2 n=1 Tax=Saimiri boliviensis TaxID=27679 RepID=UPI003D77B163